MSASKTPETATIAKPDRAPSAPTQAHPRTEESGGGALSEPILRRILGLSVPVAVVLADRTMAIASILEITVGTIIEFNVPFDEELALTVANHPIGRGRAVKAGEHFGLRITRIGSVRDRIHAMGEGGTRESS